ncbi:hypothetical protein [Deferribacter abyssi]|uniref:hypothetical protein n=1 Tax=Deferribacter abyssi TaxID=213806 RepID=UPI003C24A1F3
MNTVKATFSIPQEIMDELNNYAKESGLKKSNVVVSALEMFFDYMDLKIAKERIDEIKTKNLKYLSTEEIEKELRL